MFSAKQESAAEAVKKFEEKFLLANQKISELKKKITDMTVAGLSGDDKCIFIDDCEMKDLQSIADKLHNTYGGIKAVFTGSDGNYSFAICGEDGELQDVFAKFKSQFAVRGGGRGGMVQGSVSATQENIKFFF